MNRSLPSAESESPTLDRLIAPCRWPLHARLLEGSNNRIKVIKRMAYGFRDSS